MAIDDNYGARQSKLSHLPTWNSLIKTILLSFVVSTLIIISREKKIMHIECNFGNMSLNIFITLLRRLPRRTRTDSPI
jgi:hypothetical protein